LIRGYNFGNHNITKLIFSFDNKKLKNKLSDVHKMIVLIMPLERYPDLDKIYHIGQFLGEGTYGQVYQVKNKAGKEFAAKILYFNDNIIDRVNIREISAIRKLNHKNIINCVDVVIARFLDQLCLCIILELCDNGLVDYVRSGLSLTQKIDIIMQIFEGVNYLYINGFMHGDLSYNNILVKNGCVKLIDFGFSNRHYRKYNINLQPTKSVRPVELFGNTPSYDPAKIDIWSLGCLAYFVLTEKFLHHDNLDFLKYVPPQFKFWLAAMLENDPHKRIGHKELMILLGECCFNPKLNTLSTNKKNSLFTVFNKEEKFKILAYLGTVVVARNRLEEEHLILALENSKKIVYDKKLRILSEGKIVGIFIILFWLSNKIVSVSKIRKDYIENVLKVCCGDSGLIRKLDDIYIYLCRLLNWDVDQESIYNYVSCVDFEFKKYYNVLMIVVQFDVELYMVPYYAIFAAINNIVHKINNGNSVQDRIVDFIGRMLNLTKLAKLKAYLRSYFRDFGYDFAFEWLHSIVSKS